MKAALVMGINGTKSGVPKTWARTSAWRMNPPIQAPTSGRRPVKSPWTMIPEARMTSGRPQSHRPVMFSVK